MLNILVRCVSAPMSTSNWADSGTIISVHMHIAIYSIYLFINSVWTIDLISCTTYVLFTLRVFARNLLRGNRRRNTFRISF